MQGVGDVLWVEEYVPQMDERIAIPVRYLEPSCQAITRGHVRIVTPKQADEINHGFLNRAPKEFDAKKWLDEKLSERWRLIEQWRTENS